MLSELLTPSGRFEPPSQKIDPQYETKRIVLNKEKPEPVVPPKEEPQKPKEEPPSNTETSPQPDEEFNKAVVGITNKKTLDAIAKILEQVKKDLDEKHYGKEGEYAYNIVYLFRQSLTAYHRFLSHPSEGPKFEVLKPKEFSGRYQYETDEIRLGTPAVGKGEGRFLVTLFHEYQHHLFHKIYGTPEETDIVWKFYNEAAAYIFEALLATYLPQSYFEAPHRGDFPRTLRGMLERGEAKEGVALVAALLADLKNADGSLFYPFFAPVEDKFIQLEEVVDAVDESFTPRKEVAADLQNLAEEYYEKK